VRLGEADPLLTSSGSRPLLDPPRRRSKVQFSPSLTIALFRADRPPCEVGRAWGPGLGPVFWAVSESTPILKRRQSPTASLAEHLVPSPTCHSELLSVPYLRTARDVVTAHPWHEVREGTGGEKKEKRSSLFHVGQDWIQGSKSFGRRLSADVLIALPEITVWRNAETHPAAGSVKPRVTFHQGAEAKPLPHPVLPHSPNPNPITSKFFLLIPRRPSLKALIGSIAGHWALLLLVTGAAEMAVPDSERKVSDSGVEASSTFRGILGAGRGLPSKWRLLQRKWKTSETCCPTMPWSSRKWGRWGSVPVKN
jgi:hypothetical protein